RNGAGFVGLETLPEKLSAPVGPSQQSRLLSLFQPSEAARPVFRILLVAIGESAGWLKAMQVLGLMLAAAPLPIAIGSLAAVFSVVVAAVGEVGIAAWVAAIVGALALLALGLLGSLAAFAWASLRALGPDSNYGICPGYVVGSTEPALTPWLTDVLDELAGVDGTAGPITFGEIAKQDIKLSLMTTDMTHGRPYRLPFGASDLSTFFFKKGDFDRLF